MGTGSTQWPKKIPQLSPEQAEIREDFMHYWHEVLPKRYSAIERFNQGFGRAQRAAFAQVPIRTLEVGAGLGEHIAFEDLSFQEYTALELREAMAEQISKRFPDVNVIVGDIQTCVPAENHSFDRVLAVHVLEHLPNLPAALQEICRLLRPSGTFTAVIPCEGSAFYALGRNLTSRRLFEKRYGCSYDWFIHTEHINNYWEIMSEVTKAFKIQKIRFWPFRVPIVHANAVVGIHAKPRSGHDRPEGASC